MAKPTKKPMRSTPRQDAATPQAPARKTDGWQNVLTGLGTYARDKRVRTVMEPDRLTREAAEAMWVGDFLVARIVEAPVEDMLRGGFNIVIGAMEGDENGAADGNDDRGDRRDQLPGMLPAPPPKHVPGVIEIDRSLARIGDTVDAKLEDIGLREALDHALKLERAVGGAIVWIGADDGTRNLAEPLNVEALRDVRFLNVYSAQDAVPAAYYSDPAEPKFGRVQVYRLTPPVMPAAYVPVPGGNRPPVPTIDIHESRLIVLPGIRTTRREAIARNGWGQSVVERVFEAVRDWRSGMQGSSALVQDFAQAVMKVKGLAEIIQSNDEDALRTRFAGMDAARSLLRMLVIDAEEDFERKPTPLSGLPEILDRLGNQVSAASEIPVTRLFGIAPAGLNATGAADIRGYYDAIENKRATKLRWAIERVTKLVFLSQQGPTNGIEPATWSVKFPPLWQPTAAERAAERKVVAETDAIYIDKGVLTPEEVAASRFGGDEWSAETALDVEAREMMHEAEEAAAEGATPDAPVPPGQVEEDPNTVEEGAPADPEAAAESDEPAEADPDDEDADEPTPGTT